MKKIDPNRSKKILRGPGRRLYVHSDYFTAGIHGENFRPARFICQRLFHVVPARVPGVALPLLPVAGPGIVTRVLPGKTGSHATDSCVI